MREGEALIRVEGLSVSAAGGRRTILRGVDLSVPARAVTVLVGPSGAGKSTLLRCLNRLVDLDANLRVGGRVLFHGRPIASMDADGLRARIGMLFQQPVVFPKSIYQNVIFGVRHLGATRRRDWPGVAERALREAALWEEVKDRLTEPAGRLSVGQQQRLCLARTLATGPEVILMDEPTSALDPRSTEAIERLVLRLKERHAIVLVTHNMAQARRLGDQVVALRVNGGVGELDGSPAPVGQSA